MTKATADQPECTKIWPNSDAGLISFDWHDCNQSDFSSTASVSFIKKKKKVGCRIILSTQDQ